MQELDESVFLTPVFPQIAHALVQTLKMDNTRSSADPVSESSHVGFFFFSDYLNNKSSILHVQAHIRNSCTFNW